jgi:hypothetical protein
MPNVFPDPAREPAWNRDKCGAVAAELNALDDFPRTPEGKRQALAVYRTLTNDALRVLAGLEGTERAFSQLTVRALDPDDPANADRAGPDNPTTYRPSADLRAYVDTLDGRSVNRYFYRTAYLDRAGNISALSGASVPVYLPNVVPPRRVAFKDVRLGDATVTLRWASNREADLAAYLVYRTTDQRAARDPELMVPVKRLEGVEQDTSARPAEVTWTDEEVTGGLPYWYRIEAVDSAGNRSEPTPSILVQAVDTRPPRPPVFEEVTWVLRHTAGRDERPWPADGVIPAGFQPALRVVWSTPIQAPEFLVTRRARGQRLFRPLSAAARIGPAAAGRYLLLDPDVDPGLTHEYRLKVRSTARVWSVEESHLTVGRPAGS